MKDKRLAINERKQRTQKEKKEGLHQMAQPFAII